MTLPILDAASHGVRGHRARARLGASLLSIVTGAALFVAPAASAKDPPALILTGERPFQNIACAPNGTRKVIVRGKVTVALPADGAEASLSIRCRNIQFEKDATLSFPGAILLRAEAQLSGKVHIVSTAGAAGLAAPETPALWAVVRANAGSHGAGGSGGRNAHTRCNFGGCENRGAKGGGDGGAGGGGQAGKAGGEGAAGLPGQRSGDITILARAITSKTTILIESPGGTGGEGGLGGRGWDGGDGGNGGNGGRGGNGNRVHSGKSGGNGGGGGRGGSGGDGGPGGPGGNGGNGGNALVNIWGTPLKEGQLMAQLPGGAGGPGGEGGEPGPGGRAGKGGLAGCGGSGGSFGLWRTGSGSCGTDGRKGVDGKPGADGAPGADGLRGHDGTIGALTVTNVKPTDDF